MKRRDEKKWVALAAIVIGILIVSVAVNGQKLLTFTAVEQMQQPPS